MRECVREGGGEKREDEGRGRSRNWTDEFIVERLSRRLRKNAGPTSSCQPISSHAFLSSSQHLNTAQTPKPYIVSLGTEPKNESDPSSPTPHAKSISHPQTPAVLARWVSLLGFDHFISTFSFFSSTIAEPDGSFYKYRQLN